MRASLCYRFTPLRLTIGINPNVTTNKKPINLENPEYNNYLKGLNGFGYLDLKSIIVKTIDYNNVRIINKHNLTTINTGAIINKNISIKYLNIRYLFVS